MSAEPCATIPWDRVDTVMVDMDGTLLDLAFDNYFWHELVPSRYATQHNLPEAEAVRQLTSRYKSLEGQLQWYCVEHWSETLDLDIRAMKWEQRHRIRYLPRATEFLQAVRQHGKSLLLVTNAHRDTLAVKVAQTGVDKQVDLLFSSHDFSAPKQSASFWNRFRDKHDFDPARTVLIEDSLSVLEAASAYGVGFPIAIRWPDSSQPPREISAFPSVDRIHELI